MMKRISIVLWCALVCGSLSPILATIIKPPDYSFYMFFPATPHDAGVQSRLLFANILLVSGFAIALIAAVSLAVRGFRRRRFIHLLWPILVLANPIQQPIFLEALDTYMNYRWRDKAEHLNIIGKSPSEIRKMFGDPSYEWTDNPRVIDAQGKITWQGEPYVGWDYHVIPFYWLGSKFQVFFVDGKVKGFEANDD